MKILIGASSSKIFHLNEFAKELINLGIETKVVFDTDFSDGFPSRKIKHWIKPKNTLFKKSWNKSEIVYYHIELPNYKTDNVICNGVVMESWDGNSL